MSNLSEPGPVQIAKPSRSRAAGTERLTLLSPVVARELRVALHRRDARKGRARVAQFGVLGVSLFLLLGPQTGRTSWGVVLHFYLFLAGLILAVGPVLQLSVGLFAEERRQQTLELLYLSGMGCWELFVGKLLGGALVSSCELTALVPLLAVPFLSGGVSFELFVATLACLPTVFALVLTVGALASAVSRQEGSALVVAVGLLGAWCLAMPLPYYLGIWLNGTAPFGSSWLLLSPALGPWMVARNWGGFRVADFWVWTAVTWGWAGVGLGLAGVMLKRNWRRDIERTGGNGWEGKWDAFVFGSRNWRDTLRRRWLAADAYQWLAQQDRRPAVQAWGYIGSVCVLWLLGWCAWPRVWPGTMSFFSAAILLLVGTDLLASHAAGRRMAADRRDGGLELLLTTPLSPAEMLAGQRAALRQQFLPVKRVLFALLVAMALAGLLTRPWTTRALVSYAAAWCLLFGWCALPAQRFAPLAMWVAANCGRPLYRGFRTGGIWNRAWLIYWFGTMANSLGVFGGRVRSFPNGSSTEMWVTLGVDLWALLYVAADWKRSSTMVQALVTQLRSIAQDPLPPRDDPRFKEWKDVRTRFPAPPEGRIGDPSQSLALDQPVHPTGAWLWRRLGRGCGLAWAKLRGALRNR